MTKNDKHIPRIRWQRRLLGTKLVSMFVYDSSLLFSVDPVDRGTNDTLVDAKLSLRRPGRRSEIFGLLTGDKVMNFAQLNSTLF
ncbi:hypothetical protein OUZ56_013950 [Daphnia magna]|uniref:Uncharacterized protein n=1 Tax=Daphnia magna TaxID=35525 RepID=A0ABQ9Z7F0_9CRUS|nr:hypothetical protein OUZ56_013950 [Daphnia magna]